MSRDDAGSCIMSVQKAITQGTKWDISLILQLVLHTSTITIVKQPQMPPMVMKLWFQRLMTHHRETGFLLPESCTSFTNYSQVVRIAPHKSPTLFLSTGSHKAVFEAWPIHLHTTSVPPTTTQTQSNNQIHTFSGIHNWRRSICLQR